MGLRLALAGSGSYSKETKQMSPEQARHRIKAFA
jgi:hypothetical protein